MHKREKIKKGRQGEGGGKKPKYHTKELPEISYSTEGDLQEKISEYFDNLKRRNIPNKAGLLAHLDISRKTYHDYAKKYGNTIRRANSLIESSWIQRLASPGATGAIFYLKNAFKEEYKDKIESDINLRQKPTPLLGGDSKTNVKIPKNNSNGKNS